jgi:hypothetical protein
MTIARLLYVAQQLEAKKALQSGWINSKPQICTIASQSTSAVWSLGFDGLDTADKYGHQKIITVSEGGR